MLFLLTVFTILLFHKGRKNYSNIILACYFVSQIIGISDTLFVYGLSVGNGMPIIFYPIIFTWVPLFYFYVVSLFETDFRFSWKHTFHFIPFVIVLSYTVANFYIKDYDIRSQLIESHEIYNQLFYYFGMAFNTQVIFYNLAALVQYRKYLKRIKDEYSEIDHVGNNWLKTCLFGFVIACFIVQFGIYSQRFHVFISVDWFLAGNGAFFIFFNILFYKAIISPNILHRSQIKEKYKHSLLSTSDARKILLLLEQCMDEKHPFTDSSLSLKSLSKMTDVSERNLSQVINEHRKQNFFDFVNSYRVKYAMRLLKDKNSSRRTMMDIMYDAGFNSKSTFNNAFKKHSGSTPTDFKKMNS